MADLTRDIDVSFDRAPGNEGEPIAPSARGTLTQPIAGVPIYEILVPVNNVGDDPRCFIFFETFELLDANGVVIDEPDLPVFVYGASGVLLDEQTTTCIEPNGVGYALVLWQYDDLDAVAEVRFRRLESSLVEGPPEWQQPAGTVRPVSYTLDRGPAESFLVQIEGVGPEPSVISLLETHYILFDDNGRAYWWGQFDDVSPASALRSGERATLTGDSLIHNFDGPVLDVFLIAGYEDLSVSLQEAAE